MRGWISLALALLFALGVAYFVTANLVSVSVQLPGVTLEEPLWLAMLAALLVGAAAALGACGLSIVRLKLEVRRQAKRVAELEQEVHGLRTLPIAGDATSATSAPRA